MMRPGYLFLGLLVFVLACRIFSAPVQEGGTEAPSTSSPNESEPAGIEDSAVVNVYDPARNPADDLQQAIALAQQEHKRIMLELGGDWCIWCKYMDDFYDSHPDLLQFRAEHYVLVKVNVSQENMNDAFLAQFPAAAGYPHIYILENDGTFLHSQDTAELEDGADSYVPEVFMDFLQKWALPSR